VRSGGNERSAPGCAVAEHMKASGWRRVASVGRKAPAAIPGLPCASPQKPPALDRRLAARYTTQYLLTVIVQTAVSEFPTLSIALLVKVYVPPVTVGDPLIMPVKLFSVRPGGSEPETIE
jgi:hypothetical protein